MTSAPHDPNLHWDGQRWLRWDGAQWVPQSSSYPLAGSVTYQQPQMHQPVFQQPYGSPYQQGGPSYVTDQGSKNVQATVAWVLTLLTLGYMLPWAIAATRGKSNAGVIAILNFFVGWTVIGWIASLVMACGAHQIAGASTNVTVVTAVGMNSYPSSGHNIPQQYVNGFQRSPMYDPAPYRNE